MAKRPPNSKVFTNVHMGLLALVLLSACGPTPIPKPSFTWLGEHRSVCFPDTISALPMHTGQDSLLGRIEFTYCEGRHVVTSWTDDHYAPVDGGSFWLELDSLGKIYDHSTTWPGSVIARSNSDSINDLILMAMGVASRPGRYGLRYPPPSEPKIGTVDFTKVEIYDTTETHPE